MGDLFEDHKNAQNWDEAHKDILRALPSFMLREKLRGGHGKRDMLSLVQEMLEHVQSEMGGENASSNKWVAECSMLEGFIAMTSETGNIDGAGAAGVRDLVIQYSGQGNQLRCVFVRRAAKRKSSDAAP